MWLSEPHHPSLLQCCLLCFHWLTLCLACLVFLWLFRQFYHLIRQRNGCCKVKSVESVMKTAHFLGNNKRMHKLIFSLLTRDQCRFVRTFLMNDQKRDQWGKVWWCRAACSSALQQNLLYFLLLPPPSVRGNHEVSQLSPHKLVFVAQFLCWQMSPVQTPATKTNNKL